LTHETLPELYRLHQHQQLSAKEAKTFTLYHMQPVQVYFVKKLFSKQKPKAPHMKATPSKLSKATLLSNWSKAVR